MKKKLITLLTIVCLIGCALGLVACKDSVVEVTGIALDQTQLTVARGNITWLTVTITPSDATNQKVEWSSSNQSVAIVEDGTIAAIGEGETTITAKSNNGKTASCAVKVKASQDDDVMQFDVKFDPNGGKFANGSTDPIEKTVNFGERLDSISVSREGKYTFAGWYIKGRPTIGAWNFDSYGIYEDTTLYANWDYQNDYQSVMDALASRIKAERKKENANLDVSVDILSIFADSYGYLCFVEKDNVGVYSYKTDIKDFDTVANNDEIISQIPDTQLTKIDSYDYYYTSDSDSYVANYLPIKYMGKYSGSGYAVIYGCVTDWVYDANDHLPIGPWYSCQIKALMADQDGNVFTYTATVVAGTTNFNAVIGGSAMSEEYDDELTPLGQLANDYYGEYLKDKEASVY